MTTFVTLPFLFRLDYIINFENRYAPDRVSSFAVHNASFEVAVAAGANDYSNPYSQRLSNTTRIPMGSVTKMYTAVSVLRAAERGVNPLRIPAMPTPN